MGSSPRSATHDLEEDLLASDSEQQQPPPLEAPTQEDDTVHGMVASEMPALPPMFSSASDVSVPETSDNNQDDDGLSQCAFCGSTNSNACDFCTKPEENNTPPLSVIRKCDFDGIFGECDNHSNSDF